MPESYKVESNHWEGIPAFSRETIKTINDSIKPESIRSSIVERPLTETSWPYSLSKPSAPHIVKVDGELYAVRSTAGNSNRWKVPINEINPGEARNPLNFSPQVDDEFEQYKGWQDAARYAPNDFALNAKQDKRFEIIRAFGEQPAKFHREDTRLSKFTVPTAVYKGPINDFGRADYKAYLLERAIIEHLRTGIGQEVFSDLKSQGLSTEDIGYLAINAGMPSGAIYGITRAKDGKIMYVAAEDAFDKIAVLAAYFGVPLETAEAWARNEELAHIMRMSYDKVAKGKKSVSEELHTKKQLNAIYKKHAQEHDPKSRKRSRDYSNLAKVSDWDIATTPQRYKGGSILAKTLEDVVGEAEVQVVKGQDGNLYAIVDEGDDVYITRLDVKGEYGKAEGSSRPKLDKSEIRSMNDAKAVATEEMRREAEPETAESKAD